MSKKSLFPGREPAHPVEATPFEEDDWRGLGVLAVLVAVIAALAVGEMFALSHTSKYVVRVLFPALAWSAFEVRARSSRDRVEGGGHANARRWYWLLAVVRATAVTASLEVLTDALHDRVFPALAREIAPAGVSLDTFTTELEYGLLAAAVLLVVSVRALRRRMRQ